MFSRFPLSSLMWCYFLLAFLLVANSTQAKIYAVVVGVSNYQYSVVPNLTYSDDDAYAMTDYLNTGGYHEVVRLTNSQATKANIISTATSLFSKATKQDIIVFFFSGHGTEGAFVPYDTYDYASMLSHSDVKAIFKQSKAGLKVCIADACHSGSIKIPKRNNTNNTSGLQSNSEVVVIMSSRPTEVSAEHPNLGRGIFTYYLLLGFNGYADSNRDRNISLLELFNYISYQVSNYTKDQQHPIMFGKFNKDATFITY